MRFVCWPLRILCEGEMNVFQVFATSYLLKNWVEQEKLEKLLINQYIKESRSKLL